MTSHTETTPLQPLEIEEQKQTSFLMILFAFVVMIFVVISYCASLACVQVLGGLVPEFELNVWRFGAQLLILLPIVAYKKCDVRVSRSNLPHLCVYIMLSNLMNVFTFTAGVYLPLGQLGVIGNAEILLITVLVSVCIKSERRVTMYIGCFLGVVGMLFILQPEFLFKNAGFPPPPVVNWTSPCIEHSKIYSSTLNLKMNLNGSFNPIINVNGTSEEMTVFGINVHLSGIVFGNILVFLFAVCAAASYFVVKALLKDTEPLVMIFWNGLVGTVVSLILMIIIEKPTIPSSVFCMLLLLIHALGASVNSTLFPWCLKYLTPSIAIMVHSSEVIVLMILQYTVLKPVLPGHGNWLEVFGSVLCFFGLIGGPLWQIVQENWKGR